MSCLASEHEAAQKARAQKRAWLAERGYRIVEVGGAEIEADVGAVLGSAGASEIERASQAP